ncbi:MAG: hypothetical protein NC293_04930 [Roseburia sp.]|nr:hypothetical protein [Roseburia sp.]
MFDWEGRILDNKSIMMVKAALPFLDLPVGNVVDIEGLLRAIREFCHKREQRMIDMILNFFMMKRMMSIMSMMNETQNSERGMEGMFDLIKNQIPKEQQDMFEMMSMMMSMSEMGNAAAEAETPTEPLAEPEQEASPEAAEPAQEDVEQPIPEIWQRIADNIRE